MYHRHADVAYVTGASWVFWLVFFVERARGAPLAYAHVLEIFLLTLHNWHLLRRLAILVIKAIASFVEKIETFCSSTQYRTKLHQPCQALLPALGNPHFFHTQNHVLIFIRSMKYGKRSLPLQKCIFIPGSFLLEVVVAKIRLFPWVILET